MSIYISNKNIGTESIKIGKGGIYLKTSTGGLFSFYAGETIQPGKDLLVKSYFNPNKTGELKLNPGLCINTPKGEVCHDFNTSCTFEVYLKLSPKNVWIRFFDNSDGTFYSVSVVSKDLNKFF